MATALSQVGITEDPPGSNMNPYGAHYGQDGVAWCCLFVRWCAEQAGLPFPETAYVPALEAWARDNGHTVDPADIQAGDVVCLDYSYPMGDGADHVEIAIGPAVNGWIPCVGGNTSDTAGGSISNGGGVYVNQRPTAWVSTAILLPRSAEIIDNEEDDMSKITQFTWRDPDGTRYVQNARTLESCPAQDNSPPGFTAAQIEASIAKLIAAGTTVDLGDLDWGANWYQRKVSEIGA